MSKIEGLCKTLIINSLADIYYRGLMEVDKWIQDSLEKEKC